MWNFLKKVWAVLNTDIGEGDVLDGFGVKVYYKRPIHRIGEVGWDKRFTKGVEE